MGDEKPIDPSPDGPDDASGGSLDGLNESELGTLLDQASSLAAELHADLGADDAGRARNAEAEILGEGANPADDLDAQLAELERLALKAGDEVGAEPRLEPHISASAPNAKPKVEATPTDLGVPDFMSEFTAPAAPASDPSPPSAETEGEVPDFMAEFTRPTPKPAATNPAPPPAAAGMAPPGMEDMLAGPSPAATTRPAPAPAPRVQSAPVPAMAPSPSVPAGESGGAGERVGGLLVMVALLVARCLEIMDRPFAGLGTRMKQVLGLVGIATAATTLLVLVRAMM